MPILASLATVLGAIAAGQQISQTFTGGDGAVALIAAIVALGFCAALVVLFVLWWERRRPGLVLAALVVALVVTAAVGGGALGVLARSTDRPATTATGSSTMPSPTTGPITTPSSQPAPPPATPPEITAKPRTPPATAPPAPTRTTNGAAAQPPTITVAFDRPGGCSTDYVVSGSDQQAGDQHLWVVLERYSDPAGGPHALFFAKATASATFRSTIPANTDSDARTYRFLLATADDAANNELQLDYNADRAHDKSMYPDEKRWQLPDGSTEVATTFLFPQQC